MALIYASVAAELVSWLLEPPEVFQGDELSPWDVTFTFLAVATLVLAIASIVAFLRWFHLSVRRARVLGLELGRRSGWAVTPAWAVGCWFVPIINLYEPYRITRALLRGAEGRSADAFVAAVWWGAWLLSNFVARTIRAVQGALAAVDRIP